MSGFQESNAHTPIERMETQSPQMQSFNKKDLIIEIMNGNDTSPTLSTAIQILKAIGKVDDDEGETKLSLIKAILNTNTSDDMELITKAIYTSGHVTKRTRVN